jgi:hypothetical protein
MSNIINRMQESTPKFFRILRNIGVTLATASAAIISAPVALPAIITQIAGYLAVAGSVMGIVSQAAVKHEEE